MSLGGSPTIFDLNPHEISQYSRHQVGACGTDKYGDLYRYVKAGASGISAGKLQSAPAPKTNHHNVSVAAAAAIDDQTVTVTLGATAAVANEYAGGMFCINDVDGEGVSYRITSHPAADASASLAITLERPIVEALTTSSQVTLVHNVWNGVVEAAVEERQPAGVPLVDITAAYFGWIKTRGIVAGLAGGTIALGSSVTPHASVAGAFQAAQQFVEATDASRLDDFWIVGRAPVAGVDTEYRPIALEID